MQEKLTFIIPAYNAAKTISRTIDSVLHQTDDRYRVIIINDGSRDDTESICQNYVKQNPDKITYIFQENRGLGGARNHGMELVQTEYVSFLDSDDWLMPEYVARVTHQLSLHEGQDIEVIMTLPQIYHEGSKAVSDWYDKQLFGKVFPKDGAIINPQKDTRVFQFEVNHCRKIFQMDFLKRVGFQFKEKAKWEDVFPHFYLLSNCTRCMGIGSVGFYYRIGSLDQITASRGSDRMDILCVFEDLLKYVEQEKREELKFPVMRVIVRFSIWGIRVADTGTRKKLMKGIVQIFRQIPDSYYKALRKGSRENYSKADARQYVLFMMAMRHKIFHPIFYDYLYQDIGEKIIKKLLKAGPRVA